MTPEQREQKREQKRAYYAANKERVRAYYAANKEQIIEQARAYYAANKERIIEQKRAYYAANKERVRAYRAANKERIIERDRAYRAANKERIIERDRAYRAANAAKKHGVDREALLAAQGGKCALCTASLAGFSKNKAVVDHDHSCCAKVRSCGRCVRGVICDVCNRGLGHFKDSRDLLLRAHAYLERWEKQKARRAFEAQARNVGKEAAHEMSVY